MSPEEYRAKSDELGIDRGALSRGFDPEMASILERVGEFERAYWAFKRRTRVEEPDPKDYNISRNLGECICRLVHQKFEEEVKEKTLKKNS